MLRTNLFSTKMSVPFSGTLSRSKGVIDAIHKQLRSLTLKPVGKISIKFDPFGDKAAETRNFLFQITLPKVTQTNPECTIRTEVTSDRSEPSIEFKLKNDDRVVFKSANLTALELLQLYNKYITPLAPPEQDSSVIATKATRKTAKKR